MTRPAPIIAGSLAALVLLFGAYMGAYYVLLESSEEDWPHKTKLPVYRYKSDPFDQDEARQFVLMPAHQLDRLIRPGYWEP